MRRVIERVRAEIEAGDGWIDFERYMDLVLYEPGLGYYSAGAQKLGRAGDFTTAPEISPLFGACVARQCAEVIGALGNGSVLEIGAGSGALAIEILSRLEALGRLPRHYLFLEVSADLRERQRRALEERLPHLEGLAVWLDTLPVESFDGVILANEVLDALPVARFRWHRHGVEELGVAYEKSFVWDSRPARATLRAEVDALAAAGAGWEDGYVSEYCPRLLPWTSEVTRTLRAGAVLWLDYGLPRAQYYFPERRDGTLLCHFRHRAHEDPFLYPGLQDITSWVDFSLLAQASRSAGFELAGFTTQTYFLAGLEIDLEMRRLAQDDPNRFARLANQARRLLMPGEMGERFKAMAWVRGLEMPLQGFTLKDFRHSL